MVASKDKQILQRDREIEALKDKMGEMTDEFSAMLQETLQRMAEKIEISATAFEGELAVPLLARADTGPRGGVPAGAGTAAAAAAGMPSS